MVAWAWVGVGSAGLSLAVISACEWLGRRAQPPVPHWVSRFGASKAPQRRLFRGGLVVGASGYGVFAVHAALTDTGLAAVAAIVLALAAAALALLALAPMDTHARAHVIGATGYFAASILGAALRALPLRTSAEWMLLGGLVGGAVVIVPLFAITLRRTFGRGFAAFVAFLTDETDANRWVRVCQHAAVYVSGALLVMVALDA